MNLLPISNTTTLKSLTNTVGISNLPTVLHVNQLNRSPQIGKEYERLINKTISTGVVPTLYRKKQILDTLATDNDIFELASQQDDSGWKVLSNLNTIRGYINVPEGITLPTNAYMLGSGTSVSKRIYSNAVKELMNNDGYVSPTVFNEYDGHRNYNITQDTATQTANNPFSSFQFPWGDVTLYTESDGQTIDFPCYPEEVSDGYKANYTQMPDLLYQYEPWFIYTSSGPRQNTYEFHFHRDMWTGDHRDGKANQLIRRCEACCYPMYSGSAVHANLVSLYVSGTELIHGLVTDVTPKWSGPIGLDGWYLECTLDITIVEVSKQALNYTTMNQKAIIG